MPLPQPRVSGLNEVGALVADLAARVSALELRTHSHGGAAAHHEDDHYVPALGSITLGTGGSLRNEADYEFIGGDRGHLIVNGVIVLGSTGAAVGSIPSIGLPPGFRAVYAPGLGSGPPVGLARIMNGSSGVGVAVLSVVDNATAFTLTALEAASTYLDEVQISSTVPITFGAGDGFRWHAAVLVERT